MLPRLTIPRRNLLTLLVTAAGLVASASSSCQYPVATGTLTDVAIDADDLIVDVDVRIDTMPALWDLDDTATNTQAFVTVETDAAGAEAATRLTLVLFALDDGRKKIGELELPRFGDVDDGIEGNFIATAAVGDGERDVAVEGSTLVECGSYPCESKLELVLEVEAPADFVAIADIRVDAYNAAIHPPALVVELRQGTAEEP